MYLSIGDEATKMPFGLSHEDMFFRYFWQVAFGKCSNVSRLTTASKEASGKLNVAMSPMMNSADFFR